MKLRTLMTKNIVGEWYADGWEDDSLHDAAAAHALLQAMNEVKNEVPHASCRSGIEYVLERADELMREWTTSEPSSSQR